MNDDEVVLIQNQNRDMELHDMVCAMLKIVVPDDIDITYIPFCIIYPVLTEREHYNSRYKITCYFRQNPGSAAMRTRIMGMLLRTQGIGGREDPQDEMLWRRWKTQPAINVETRVVSYNHRKVTPEVLEDLEDRYELLDDAISDFQDVVKEYDTCEPARYSFVFYEHWSAIGNDDDNDIHRKWVYAQDLFVPFMHDAYCPMYKMIAYVAQYGLTNTGFAHLMSDIRENMNEGVNLTLNDPALGLYEHLTMI